MLFSRTRRSAVAQTGGTAGVTASAVGSCAQDPNVTVWADSQLGPTGESETSWNASPNCHVSWEFNEEAIGFAANDLTSQFNETWNNGGLPTNVTLSATLAANADASDIYRLGSFSSFEYRLEYIATEDFDLRMQVSWTPTAGNVGKGQIMGAYSSNCFGSLGQPVFAPITQSVAFDETTSGTADGRTCVFDVNFIILACDDGNAGADSDAQPGDWGGPPATPSSYAGALSATLTLTPKGSPPVPCAQPLSSGPVPIASDCLFILNAAVGLQTCSPECTCAPSGQLPPSATDASICLSAAVGTSGVSLNCPC
jgi:hypothetical protein